MRGVDHLLLARRLRRVRVSTRRKRRANERRTRHLLRPLPRDLARARGENRERKSLTFQTPCLKFGTRSIEGMDEMDETPHDVTETELAVLEVLWERGTATVRQVTEVL